MCIIEKFTKNKDCYEGINIVNPILNSNNKTKLKVGIS